MFGNRDLTDKVATQAVEIERLERENALLRQQLPDSNEGAVAKYYSERIQEWVDRGYSPTDLQSGIPMLGMEPVIQEASSYAASKGAESAFENASPEARLDIVERTLTHDELRSVALRGLSRAILANPREALEVLPQSLVQGVLDKIVDDPEKREKVLNSLFKVENEGQNATELQKELEKYGHFSSDNLPLGAKVAVEHSHTPYNEHFTLIGRVVETEAAGRWISVTSYDWTNSNFGSGRRATMLSSHMLVRLGHKNGEDNIVPQVVPRAPHIRLLYSKNKQVVNHDPFLLKAFTVDGERVYPLPMPGHRNALHTRHME